MNRTLLLIICDFLLLSLLAFGKFDGDLPEQSAPEAMNPGAASSATTLVSSNMNKAVAQDLVQVLRSSLEEEQKSREVLTATLSQTEQNLRNQQEMLAEREARISAAQRSLQQKEAEARSLEQARAALESKFTDTQSNLTQLQQQLASTSTQAKMSQERLAQIQAEYQAAQSNLLGMQKELTTTSVEARTAQERLVSLEQEVKTRAQEAEEARKRAAEIAEARRLAEVERERIAGQLKVAETEQKNTRQQLQQAQQNIQVVQQEKAQIQQVAKELAQGVVQFAEGQKEVAATQKELARAQTNLTQEIRENRPLSANTIFNEFVTNRVNTDFRANRTGVLGRNVSRERQAKTILVSDGMQTYAIYHISDTPLKFEDFGTDWDRLVLHLLKGQGLVQPNQISFLSIDPRIVVAPVTEAQAKQLGAKVYRVVKDPYKFQDALLIGASEGYYGEARFTIDAQLRNYIKMDRTTMGRFFGKFTPSRGDLVYSKSGELLGVMVNDDYAALLTSFVPTATIPLGPTLSLQQTGYTLSSMQAYVNQLPERLR